MVLDGIRASKLLLKGTEISHLLCRNVIFRQGGGVAGHDPCRGQDGVISLTDSFQTTTR